MKSLELTVSHREKLLEMCKKLFPEYPPHVSSFDCRECGCIDDYLQVNVNGDIIHWFEFCMTHLAKRMLTHNDGEADFDDYIAFTDQIAYGKHPVDYLYKQFLKED